MMSDHKQASSEMRRRGERTSGLKALACAVALSALAAGCASTNATTAAAADPVTSVTAPTPPVTTSTSPAMPMTPGMQMPGTTQDAAPSSTSLMICGPEIQKAVMSALALRSTPITTTTWTDQLYTCTYHLPVGQLVLSVKESPDAAAADAYFTTLRRQLGSPQPLTGAQGLGNPGYESAGGTVVILKDGKTLKVDATGMPPTSGSAMTSRVDLAYEIATDILGCWSE